MKAVCLFVGKTTEKYIEEGMNIYLKRLKHYLDVSVIIVPSSSARSKEAVLLDEAEIILKKIAPADFVVLLDEKGRQFTSEAFAGFAGKLMTQGKSKIIFVTGGAFGAGSGLKKRANLALSFSSFTLTHQMIRLFFLEQLYRAMTILKNESYHHS